MRTEIEKTDLAYYGYHFVQHRDATDWTRLNGQRLSPLAPGVKTGFKTESEDKYNNVHTYLHTFSLLRL